MTKKLLFVFFALTLLISKLSGQTFLIFGGKSHDVFLGCLNCDKHSDKSIWNKYSDFGSKHNDKSIWNKYGDYGGKYSDYSPFNRNASYPPVIVDPDGNFYGYFTADKYKDKRTEIKLALIIIENWEIIQDDVSESYETIFK